MSLCFEASREAASDDQDNNVGALFMRDRQFSRDVIRSSINGLLIMAVRVQPHPHPAKGHFQTSKSGQVIKCFLLVVHLPHSISCVVILWKVSLCAMEGVRLRSKSSSIARVVSRRSELTGHQIANLFGMCLCLYVNTCILKDKHHLTAMQFWRHKHNHMVVSKFLVISCPRAYDSIGK